MKYMNVEFLRFTFSLMIVYYHIFIFWIQPYVTGVSVYSELTGKVCNAYIIVEFFLIMAGFFFYQTLQKRKQSWNSFALNKIARLWPVLAVAICSYVMIKLAFGLEINLYTQFLNLLFLQCIGVTLEYKSELWFISTYFWVMLFYFYILKNWKKENALLI